MQDDLNSQQQQAVNAAGFVAIVAGPGTGKTKTLVSRITHLVNNGVAPEHILALTFTKKSAEELKVRLGCNAVWAGTFHALCHEILGGEQAFISEIERFAVIKKLPHPKGMTTRGLALAISKAKNTGDQALADVIKEYDGRLANLGLIDFDDLLLRAKELLKNNAALCQEIQARFTHVLVDEFQDTNPLQYEILRLLVTNELFVIGDPKQSIYGFRGASGSVFATLQADYPQCKKITLSVNYRSAQSIVAAANALFEGNLRAYRNAKGGAKAVHVLNELSEATWVLNTIQQGIGGSDLQKATSNSGTTRNSLKDFAILYRNRSVARITQQQIEQSGLPYQVVGDGSPYDDPNVQKIIGCLAALAGREVNMVGFNDNQLKAVIKNVTAREPYEIAQQLLTVFGFEPNHTVKQFLATLTKFKTASDASDYFESISQQQFYDANAEAITLLTIHASKGLEFPFVFLLGGEEGVIPGVKGEISEEKRLFYVALTRAKDTFVTLHTSMRHGRTSAPSRFIKEAALTVAEDPQFASDKRRALKRKAKQAQIKLF